VESNRFLPLGLMLFSLLAVLAAGSRAYGQEFRGSIKGQVTDPQGAIVPGAKITVVREGTQEPYAATTNAAGTYSIPYVLPGVYKITVEAQGFKRATSEAVTLDVAQKLNLDFQLEIGSVSEQVLVQADSAMVNTGDASGGSVLDTEKIQNLPLNGRQVYMLLSLTPGVRFTQTQFGAQGFSGTRGWDVNSSYVINGVGTRGYNQFTLNGAPITIQQNGTWEIAPNVDGIQEVNIMTNTYDAQYGRAGGGTVNMVMKAGTNAFHGTVFDYFRNSVFDANTFTNDFRGAPKGLHNQHQFGGTVGGPIQRDKTFFFFSFEGWREVVPFPVGPTSTPAAAFRMLPNGSVDFTPSGFVIYDPLSTHCANNSNPCNSFIRDPFPGNVIPANRINPTGLKLLGLYPQPNGPGVFNNFFATGLLGRYNYNQPIVRVDRSFGDKTRVYGLFAWWRGHEFRNTQGFDGPAQRGNILTERDDTSIVLDATHTFSATIVGDLRISLSRFHSNFPDGSVSAGTASLTAQDLGLNMPQIATTTHGFAPQIQVDQYPDIIGNTIAIAYETNFDVAPSVTQSHGRHTFHYGGDYMLIAHANPGIGQPNGIFHFGPGFTQRNPFQRGSNDGFGLADLLLGYPDSGSVQFNTTYYGTYPYFAFYFQDDIKLRSNLTLNLGLRWDDEVSVKERFNRLVDGFCFTCKSPLTGQITFPANNTLPNGATMPNPILGGITFAGVNGSPDRPYKNYLDHWQPKIGIAWAINPKTVLRGGYGISHAFGIDLDLPQTGFSQTTSYISSVDGGLTPTNFFHSGTPFQNGILLPIGSSQGLLTGAGAGITFDQPTRRIPRVHQWSLGIQRELPKSILLDISYVGTYAAQLRAPFQFNTLTADAIAEGAANHAFLDQNVPNPFFGVLPAATALGSSRTVPVWRLMVPFPEFNGSVFSNTEPDGFSTYEALKVKAEKRISNSGAAIRGLSFITSFTWSKSMRADNYVNQTNGNGNAIQDPQGHLNYVIADYDRPWDLAISGVWGLPFGQGGLIGKDARGLIGHLINNWNLDWIVTAAGGTPVGLPPWVFNCPNHPSIVPTHSSGAELIYNENMSCYSAQPEWTPRANPTRVPYIRNPWEPQASVALQKQWAFKEQRYIQFRAEAFNVTNTPIFGGPDTNRNDTPGKNANGQAIGFGTINLQQQNFPRQVQFSLKILF